MITLTIDQLAADVARKYGHDQTTARSRFDAIRVSLEQTDETTVPADQIDPIDAADMLDEYVRTYVFPNVAPATVVGSARWNIIDTAGRRAGYVELDEHGRFALRGIPNPIPDARTALDVATAILSAVDYRNRQDKP